MATAQALLFSLDSLVAGLLTGIVVRHWRWRIVLAALFGVCDGIGTICGAMMPHVLPSLPDLGLYALLVTLVALAARRSMSWLLLMPLLLSIDNLSSGAPIDTAPASVIVSAVVALFGMTASAGAFSLLPSSGKLRQRTARVSGAG
jgi:putative Mn2+ efflux pump MntP